MASITPPGPGRSEAVNRTEAPASRPQGNSGSRESSSTPRQSGAAGSVAAPSEADGVSLSGAARQAAAIEGRVERQPVFDAQRVAELRSAIESGEYRVDSERLARAITRLERLG
mgnify:CR=1 FL=1